MTDPTPKLISIFGNCSIDIKETGTYPENNENNRKNRTGMYRFIYIVADAASDEGTKNKRNSHTRKTSEPNSVPALFPALFHGNPL
jgi:hypothetical protein